MYYYTIRESDGSLARKKKVGQELLTAATFAVRRREEALVALAAVTTREVVTDPVRTDVRLLTFIDVWRHKKEVNKIQCSNVFLLFLK